MAVTRYSDWYDPIPTRLRKFGNTQAVVIPKHAIEALGWPLDSTIAIRRAGDKLICERIPLEKFSKLGGLESEAVPRA